MVQLITPNAPIQLTGAPMDVGASLGNTIEKLGTAAFADQLTPEVKRRQIAVLTGKATAQDRENAGVEALSALARGGNYDPNASAAEGIRAGLAPTVVGGYKQYMDVNKYGAGSKQATDATMAVPGSSYGSTVQGVNAGLANARTLQSMQEGTKMRIAAQTPQTVLVDGVPTIVRQDQAYGKPASVSNEEQKGALARKNFDNLSTLQPEQQKYLGAEPKKDDLYNATLQDGTVIPVRDGASGPVHAQTGEKVTQPITSIGKLVASDVNNLTVKDTNVKGIVEGRVATNTAVAAIDRLKTNLMAPNADQSVGLIGKSASMFNNLRSQVEATVRLAGGTSQRDDLIAEPGIGQSITRATNSLFENPNFNAKAQQLGISHSVLQSQISDLAYTIAKARDPQGRQSDQDVARAAETVGASLGDPAAMSVVLDEVKHSIVTGQAIREQTTKDAYGAKNFPISLNGAQPPVPSQVPTAGPAAAAAAGGAIKWTRGADGRPVPVQ